MSEEMEIMQEFKYVIKGILQTTPGTTGEKAEAIMDKLILAVRWEICRALEKFKKPYIGIDPSIEHNVNRLIDKYFPKPHEPVYCEAMQYAITQGYVEVTENNGKNEYRIKGVPITKCPYPTCHDGKNCIGDKLK